MSPESNDQPGLPAHPGHPTGPRTEEGKSRSRLNAISHGLTGQVHCITDEQKEAFDNHCRGMMEALQPEGCLELDLAQDIAENRWRLKRARALESNIFALGTAPSVAGAGNPEIDTALDQARTWLANAKDIQLLALYEQRIHRNLDKSEARLEALQNRRKAAHAEALEEAKDLAKLSMLKGEPIAPAAIDPVALGSAAGFVFSTADIELNIDREVRFAEAQHYKRNQWDKTYKFQRPGFRRPKAA